MSDKLQESLDRLEGFKKSGHKKILVAFSGGKDALCTADLACRVFKKVTGFYMYLVPGLQCIEETIEAAKNRWGIEILQYPGRYCLHALKQGVYCKNRARIFGELPDVPESFGMYKLIKADTGADLILDGAKYSDYPGRCKVINQGEKLGFISPIKEWRKNHVMEYLALRHITLNYNPSKPTSGVTLSAPGILWLYDEHPEDYKKILKWFPYVESIVYRRKWFGITGEEQPKRKHR